MTALVAILAWFFGAQFDPSPWRRVFFVMVIGILLLTCRGPITAAWRFVSRHAPHRDAKKYDRDLLARVDGEKKPGIDLYADRRDSLKATLQDRHGWRWRYADRWVLVAGDEPLVKRLAPGLADIGYAIAGDTVLLYAHQTTDKLDTDWLDEIRRLRSRRPVDAVVAVTRNRSAGSTPFDTDNLSRRLARHARSLRWAAPVYLLNVTEFGTGYDSPDDAIGFTWSNSRVSAGEIDASLRNLGHNLADTGVVRIAHDKADRYAALLSQHIEALGSALSGLVLQTSRSRYWRHAVHGLLFAPLFKAQELARPAATEDPADAGEGDAVTLQPRTIWQTVADHSRKIHGRRVGLSFSTIAAWITTAAIGLWIVGTMASGFTNRATIGAAQDTLAKLSGTLSPGQGMQTLDSLDKQIDTLESRQRDGAPWTARFGLNRDSAVLAVLWPGYE
ncbi:type VI secretion protein VasK, partial [Paraburkholderia sp. BR10936]